MDYRNGPGKWVGCRKKGWAKEIQPEFIIWIFEDLAISETKVNHLGFSGQIFDYLHCCLFDRKRVNTPMAVGETTA